MDAPLSSTTLASLISRCTGVPVTGQQIDERQLTFADLGVDSLGLLGVVAELKRGHGMAEADDVDIDQSPHELLALLSGKA